ncbi:MAG: hypothetical protein AVDCRST_MAG85-2699 [uncultured Solirubrobacteraceae bacterium]|uniref:Uncharacterized protein n=1 Tax=uncultured Solirubrobacteraceae bacterium TaxID=1162706 RepID=A0A6J4TA64_9ACTN|nr:MAG: hypothetical protein AVDCRST_MAG85-2699 [uncultured Solirubrobacteraceae bacterium]
MRRILLSGELWGHVPKDRTWPAVQAYHGPLADGEPGFEFWAATPPDSGYGPPHWRRRDDGSVRLEGDVAKIRIYVTRVSEDLL